MSGRIEQLESGEVIRCIDPRSGAETVTLPCTPIDQLPAIVSRARVAGRAWAALPLPERRAALGRLRAAFLGRAGDVVQLLAEECGRPAGEAWTSEVAANNGLFGWWIDNIDDLLCPDRLSLSPQEYPKKRGLVRLEPLGVIGLIMPWNFPVALPLRSMVPALLAGNAIVLKPSEHSPRLGALLGELCAATLPADLVQIVQGGAPQGAALIDAGIDRIIFTGSVRTGRKVGQMAAERLIPASLELGGKDAALVLPDADPDRVAAGVAWAAFGFAGQNCAAIERCYVHASIYPAVLEKLVARAKALRPLVDLGPLVTEAQLQIVRQHLEDAVAKGARVECGGQAPGPGWFHQATVLSQVTEDMTLMQEETFGPLLPVLPYTDLDAVIDRVNGTDYGLTTSIWTRDLAAAEAMAGRFECGVVTINNHAFTGALPAASWGGVKNTGHGVTNSRFALYEMVRPRTVVTDAMGGDREMWWYPYNDALVDAASGLVELSRAGGSKLQGVRTALSGLLNRWKVST